MEHLDYLAYRYLTNAEFFNINKPRHTEKRGGGQTYIDFPVRKVTVADWRRFLAGVSGVGEERRAAGPSWTLPIHSIGVSAPDDPQTATLFQRRAASVSVAAQRLGSEHSNRILAWHPSCGFPEPTDPNDRRQLPPGLVVFLAKTRSAEVWAGWFVNARGGSRKWGSPTFASELAALLDPESGEGDAGILDLRSAGIAIDPTNRDEVFHVAAPAPRSRRKSRERTNVGRAKPVTAAPIDERFLVELFSEDVATSQPTGPAQTRVVNIRRRSQKAVSGLKRLYGDTCQISGNKYLFKKRDGRNYTEAHHLIPLGSGGDDSPFNIVIVSSHLHRMLHYATVGPIDLRTIRRQEDGAGYLDIEINGEPHRIRWHPRHAVTVVSAVGPEPSAGDGGDTQ